MVLIMLSFQPMIRFALKTNSWSDDYRISLEQKCEGKVTIKKYEGVLV